MAERSKYKTKQSEIMLEYFKKMAGKHVTAADVCEYFKEQGAPIGQATVYRRLESLVDEGVLSKYTIDPSSPACFEYMGEDSHVDGDVCFHLKCEKCGKLIHMHCEEMEEMQTHMKSEHGFKMDPIRTVFYGLCKECQ